MAKCKYLEGTVKSWKCFSIYSYSTYIYIASFYIVLVAYGRNQTQTQWLLSHFQAISEIKMNLTNLYLQV